MRTSSRFWTRLYAAVLILVGLLIAPAGGYLLSLGGSPYYLLAGLALIASGVLLWRGDAKGAMLYALFLIVTLGWAVWEVGLDGWSLVPRAAMFAVLGLPLLPRLFRAAAPLRSGALLLGGFVVALGVGLALPSSYRAAMADPAFALGVTGPRAPVVGADGMNGQEWLNFGNDQGGKRFSPLTQLNTDTVKGLKVAWQYRAGPGLDGKFGHIEATPLKIGNHLYLCTSYNDVISLDAETGQEVWRFKSGIDRKGFMYGQCRGVAYYKVPDATGPCAERIITNTTDSRLIALDMATGRTCPGFGKDGTVSLLTGMGDVPKGYYFVSSAPTIVRGKVVLGGWVADGQYWGEPSGVIRAFDAVTGAFAWAFDAGRPDRQTEPPPGEEYTRGTPNSWAPMSADEALGLVYAPTGNATPDYYGAQRRPFDDEYSSAVVAIDVETGKVRWSFQTIHHDLWDKDVASQPMLIDIPLPTGPRKALIQATKRGELFIVDRETGEPIFGMEERPVPQRGHAPGERLSPTQPFPVGIPPLTGPDLTEASMWGLTPFDQLWCRVKFKGARYDGKFTPPGLDYSISFPGYAGGMNWGSLSVDLDRHLLISNNNRLATGVQLISRADADKRGLAPMSETVPSNIGRAVAQAGTPYAADINPFLSPLNVPCTAPPYGMLTAVDLVSGKLVWTHRFGTGRDAGPFNIPSHMPFVMGTPNFGGAVTTRGGLIFIGATQDGYMHAFDTKTGKLLWKDRLPAGGNANPITYMSEASGRQFVVIAASGHGGLQNRQGDYVVAYALPKDKVPPAAR